MIKTTSGARANRRAQRGAVLFACALGWAATAQAQSGLDAVVATRGDAVLTLGEVDAKVRSMPPELRAGYLTDPDRIARLIDGMLLAEQVALDAQKRQLDKDPEYLADVALVSTELLSGRHVRDFVESVKAPNFENLAHERYLANPKQFTPPANAEYRQVVISTDGRDENDARGLAQKILDRAKAGEDFASVIADVEKSEAEGVASGVVKSADAARLDTAFVLALAALKETGDLAGPVRSRFGYHVIRLERVETYPTPSFDLIKDKLVEEMRAKFLEEEKTRYLRGYSQLDTELMHEVINTLPSRYSDKVAEAKALLDAAAPPEPSRP